jgi:hypothetical protein
MSALHLSRAIVHAASILVPRDRRAEWRAEWAAELHHVQARGGPALRMALGAVADALELGMGPRAFADAARFGWAPLARAPLQVATAAAALAAAIGAAGVCLALAWRVAARPAAWGSGSMLLLGCAVLVVVALVGSAARVAASLIRAAVVRHPSTVPCAAQEVQAAAALLCWGAALAGLLIAAAGAARFPGTVPAWSIVGGAAQVLGPIVLATALASAALRRWAAPRIEST